jgi:hypothetical protein
MEQKIELHSQRPKWTITFLNNKHLGGLPAARGIPEAPSCTADLTIYIALDPTREEIMLRNYKNAGNIALGIAAVCAAAIVVLGQKSTNGNVWGPGGAPPVLMYATGLSVIAMFWAYVKAKGHSGWLGVLLPLLSIVGLAVLLRLTDRHPPTEMPSPKQDAAKTWATYALLAVGLGAMAYVIFVVKSNGG